MKFLITGALVVSLAFNAAVAFLFFAGRATPAPAATIPVASASGDDASPVIDTGVWPDLRSEDLPTLIARLRASGFPPAVVRAILAAQLEETFAARRKALTPSAESLPFWKEQPRDPALQAARRRLDREQQKLLRELFGNEADADDPMNRATQNRSFKFLPPEKAEALRDVVRSFDEKRSDLYDAGINESTDREKLTGLDKEMHDAIARMLTPAELLEYDLRTSPTAFTLRDSLRAFNPTEEEFRALYQLRAPFDEQFGRNFGLTLSGDERRQRSEAEKILNEQTKVALGPDRAVEYDRTTDSNYRRTSQLVARLELPPETTGDLAKMQKEFTDRRRLIPANGITADQRSQQLAALQQEALARVTPLLGGASAVEAYKQYGGQWLQSLAPRPAAPTVKP